jgi:hypothetical protein
MRRWLVLPAALALLGGAACGNGMDDDEGTEDVETTTPVTDLADAVAVAQRSMPVDLPDSRVGILLEDLCAGDAPDLEGLSLADQAQLVATIAALEAGSDDLCPGSTAPALLEEARAATPPPAPDPAGAAAAAAEGGGGAASSGPSGATGGSSAASGSAASGSGAGSSSGASNSSAGSASSGGGNATGTGNSSDTDFTQAVGSGSSGSSSSGAGASNSASVGSP